MAGLLSAVLFVASLAVLAFALRHGVDEWLANVRPAKAYHPDSPRCYRCSAGMEPSDGRCPRCRTSRRWVEIHAIGHVAQWAMYPRIAARSYVHHTVRGSAGEEARFIAPGNVKLQTGHDLRFIGDARGTLRAVENRSLESGWRLPTRAVGEHSPWAMVGAVIAVPALLLLLFVMPLYFLLTSVEHLTAAARTVSGAQGGDPGAHGANAIFLPTVLWGMAAVLLGGALLGLRSRPRINRRLWDKQNRRSRADASFEAARASTTNSRTNTPEQRSAVL